MNHFDKTLKESLLRLDFFNITDINLVDHIISIVKENNLEYINAVMSNDHISKNGNDQSSDEAISSDIKPNSLREKLLMALGTEDMFSPLQIDSTVLIIIILLSKHGSMKGFNLSPDMEAKLIDLR